jgi:hypothetical protein
MSVLETRGRETKGGLLGFDRTQELSTQPAPKNRRDRTAVWAAGRHPRSYIDQNGLGEGEKFDGTVTVFWGLFRPQNSCPETSSD